MINKKLNIYLIACWALLTMFLQSATVSASSVTGGLSRIDVDGITITVEEGSILQINQNKIEIRALGLSPRIILDNSPDDALDSFKDAVDDTVTDSVSGILSLMGKTLQEPAAEKPEEESSKIFEFTVSNINPYQVELIGDAQLMRGVGKVFVKVILASGEKKEIKLQPSNFSSDSFSFAVMGESRQGDRVFKNIIKKLNESSPLFAVNCGDLVNTGKGLNTVILRN